MRIKCVTAATNPNGDPDFHFCIVEATEDEIGEGDHYGAARKQAEADDYGGQMVTFDEHDDPGFLMDQFEWSTATVVKLK